LTLGSQLGIPADFQRGNESGLDAAVFDRAFVLVGHSGDSAHGNIYDQGIIYEKVTNFFLE